MFDQQVRDFKRVWAGLDSDIALVCLCGNHDVGNRPTRASIKHWASQFGDDCKILVLYFHHLNLFAHWDCKL